MHNKTLIICYHPYSYMGGATSKIIQLLNGLNKKKYKIVYIYLKKNYELDLNKEIKTIKLNAKSTLLSFFETKKIINKFDKKIFKKKIFISNQNYSNILTYFLIKNFKEFKSILIERNHLDEFNYYNSLKDFFKKKIIKRIMKFNYKYASLVIGNSKRLSIDLSNFTNSKVKTIYSPTNSKKVIQLSKLYTPKELKKDKSRVRILSVSRFSKRKDIITLLKAFNIIHNKFPKLDLILIGYGSELDKIKSFVKFHKLSKKVYVLSPKKNPFPYFLISDLYVMPSLYEGCPNSIVEALVLNLPVISSNCNSGPSEILLNGKGGFIFKKHDFYSLANKIQLFLRNKNILIKKLKIAKKNTYRFEEKLIINKYKNLLDNI